MQLTTAGAMGAIVAGALLAGAATPPPALARLQPGQWQFREAGTTMARAMCLADPAAALRIGHVDVACTQSVIESAPTTLTVRYSCAGAGHGRSTLTVRTPTSFRLQTQGLSGGAPFEFDYEARRIGDCAGSGDASPR